MAKQIESITIRFTRNELRLLIRALYVTRKTNRLYAEWTSNELWETPDQYAITAFREYIKNEIGKCTYTHMLNSDGGIEADLTIVCMDKNYFRFVTSAANRTKSS